MAQSFLGPNPGTVVRDALAPKLFDGSVVSDTVDGDWVEVNFPGCVAVVAEIGAADSSAALDVEVQGADDPDGPGGVVAYGRFAAIGEDDDNQVRVLVADVYKPYMRVTATESGGGEVELTVWVGPKDFWQGSERTA